MLQIFIAFAVLPLNTFETMLHFLNWFFYWFFGLVFEGWIRLKNRLHYSFELNTRRLHFPAKYTTLQIFIRQTIIMFVLQKIYIWTWMRFFALPFCLQIFQSIKFWSVGNFADELVFADWSFPWNFWGFSSGMFPRGNEGVFIGFGAIFWNC